ncbi:hypothetical protein EDB81DRAFT_859911 [Dactylonectria macrodidyma]|uniref:Uncharacterized protein n=1 Tax=Dactylonectria macrodidyma TaxID=307937 RepID=A0A9P9IQ23_9HYPO|nr:hypothetical protein EDB81DRAFT_859911 [Dactylonectria macrodidyma]
MLKTTILGYTLEFIKAIGIEGRICRPLLAVNEPSCHLHLLLPHLTFAPGLRPLLSARYYGGLLRFYDENGRTYHAMSSNNKCGPGDNIITPTMRAKTSVSGNICDHEGDAYAAVANRERHRHASQPLGLSPKTKRSAKRAWDAGTRTGLWAKRARLEDKCLGDKAYAVGASTGKAGCPNRLGQLWAGTRNMGDPGNLGQVDGGRTANHPLG